MRDVLLVLLLALASIASAQGPVLHQSDMWTLAYEDLSDLLRRYPGMYPLDYGTLGAPLFFRPWQLHPWEFRVERDGIPQNRRSDGLFEPNLQPASEIETIHYDALAGGATGRVELSTRSLPVDTPYTEFQIREGFYGYGVVDFAHAQRLHRSLTLEMTGRLGWYDGMRSRSASRSTRVRGRIGVDLNKRWRANLTYAGSDVKSEFVLSDRDYVPSREEGMLTISPKDSSRASLTPSFTLYSREDREKWGAPWHAREWNSGLLADARTRLAGQYLALRNLTSWTEVNFPGMDRRHELVASLTVCDSVPLPVVALRLRAGLRRESGWSASRERDHRWLSDLSIQAATHPVHNISVRAGGTYSETAVPPAWWWGRYLLAHRPLVVEPEMTDLTEEVVGVHSDALPVDRYLTTECGVRWSWDRALLDIGLMNIRRPGDFASRFVERDSSVSLGYVRAAQDESTLGLTGGAVVPLWYGLRIESWWFAQSGADDPTAVTDARGWSRLYFERSYFKSPLTVRCHISHEHIGRRVAFSDRAPNGRVVGPNDLVGFRISATVRGVTLIWGTENLLKEHYAFMPGYQMIAKEEYLMFIWRLWL